MCGLAGFLEAVVGPGAAGEWRARLDRMGAAIDHRGPDDRGTWLDADAGIGLSHRRLSVLDLSPAGHQPMTSSSGRYVIAFNGEIYNHPALRRELERTARPPATPVPGWRGRSDTETLLAGFDAWGVAETLARSVGMFALATWDRSDGTLSLARDRMGEKPLYYGWQGTTLLFGSELKALRAHPQCRAEVDRDALALYLRHGYVPAPHSIYRGIRKLPAGTLLEVRRGDRGATPRPYWAIAAFATAAPGPAADSQAHAQECLAELERRLGEAIAGQMIADVPLGAFLSGGIDSSLIVALMQRLSPRPVRTFSIGFREGGYDEAEHARAVAAHLGTDHTELYVTPQQAMAVIPRLPAIYDEPFADSSQIPTVLVSELARRQVTVSLSGDGGDELFGGYTRYLWTAKVLRRAGGLPHPVRTGTARLLAALPPATWNRMFEALSALLPKQWRYATPGDKLHKLADLLFATRPQDAYREVMHFWKGDGSVVLGARAGVVTAAGPGDEPALADIESRMMYLDQAGYLPDDILTKVDRAAMASSLETRIPLLDHRIVEFAWSLPPSLKMRDGVGKWPLRQLLYRHVPPPLLERPKMGFAVPLDAWLRGPLRAWAESLLHPARLAREGWFAPAPIRRAWEEHASGRRNRSAELWSVLMFQAWLETWHGQPA